MPNPQKPKQDKVLIPAHMIPSFNVHKAFENKCERRWLILCWGGLGDQVCAEPTIRYAMTHFRGVEITVATEFPELFSHLRSGLKEIISYSYVQENPQEFEGKYMIFSTIVPPTHLTWEFFSHCLVNAVDFTSMCCFRMQLPINDKPVVLTGDEVRATEENGLVNLTRNWPSNSVVIHPGRHWPSKTFPASWWNGVITDLIGRGLRPILIGRDTWDNRGTVDVMTDGCLDLRNRTNLSELIWLLHSARVVLTNDSSPLHLASSGKAWIGYVASCKHPDYITHWRRRKCDELPVWGWRMENLGRDGIWNHQQCHPMTEVEISVEHLPAGLMDKILPDPMTASAWCEQKLLSFEREEQDAY